MVNRFYCVRRRSIAIVNNVSFIIMDRFGLFKNVTFNQKQLMPCLGKTLGKTGKRRKTDKYRNLRK